MPKVGICRVCEKDKSRQAKSKPSRNKEGKDFLARKKPSSKKKPNQVENLDGEGWVYTKGDKRAVQAMLDEDIVEVLYALLDYYRMRHKESRNPEKYPNTFSSLLRDMLENSKHRKVVERLGFELDYPS